MTHRISLKERLGFARFEGFDALLLCVWTLPVLMLNLRGIVNSVFGESWSSLFIPCTIIITSFLSFRYIVQQLKGRDYLFVVCCVGYYYFCCFYYTKSTIILDELETVFLVQTLPFYIIGLCLDIDRSFILLRTLSLVCIVLKMLSFFLFGIADAGTSLEDIAAMSVAHNILPYCLILVWCAFRNGRVYDWIVAVMSILFLLSLGNRGSLLALLLFVVLYMLFFKVYKNPLRSRLILLILGVIVFLLLKPIMLLCMNLFSSIGMSTRIFAKFLANDIADDNGRIVLIENTMNLVKNGPFLGFGIAGDRVINNGLWCHNLFVEMMATFGYYPGLFLVILLVVMIVKSFRNGGRSNKSIFLLLLLCTCSILLVSSSFVQYPFFFFMLGYCVRLLRKKGCV